MKAMQGVGAYILCTALALGLVSRADAGAKSYPNVSINTTTRIASGAFGTARRVGVRQYISCDYRGGHGQIHCEAVNELGTKAFCDFPAMVITDTRYGILLGNINPDSFIRFAWGTGSDGTPNLCFMLQVINSSEYEPKR